MNKIEIKNYRSIKKAELELAGINVVIGPTDSGKSNLYRALRDFAFNTRGEDFVTKGEKVTEIDVDEVIWQKGKGKNQYVVPGFEDPFTKVGVNCPEEVTQVHGLREVDFGQGVVKRINFSGQFDSHFIVNESEQDSAKIVTSILPDINMVLEGTRQAVLKIRHLTNDLEHNQKQQTEIQEDLEGKEKFEVAGKKIDKLSEIGNELKNKADDIKEKAGEIKLWNRLNQQKDLYNNIVESLDAQIKPIEDQNQALNRLSLINHLFISQIE